MGATPTTATISPIQAARARCDQPAPPSTAVVLLLDGVVHAGNLESHRQHDQRQPARPARRARRARIRLDRSLCDCRWRALDHEANTARRSPGDLARQRHHSATRQVRAVDPARGLLPGLGLRAGRLPANARADRGHRAAERAAQSRIRIRTADPGRRTAARPGLAASNRSARRRNAHARDLEARGTAWRSGNARQEAARVGGQDPGRRHLLADIPALSAGDPRHVEPAGAARPGAVHDERGSGLSAEPVRSRAHRTRRLVRGAHSAADRRQPAGRPWVPTS